MVEPVLSAIELCRLITETGKTIYDASNKVAKNFKEQRRELGDKVNDVKKRAERLQNKLIERRAILEHSDNIKDMHSLLIDINEVFLRTKMFFEKLEKYESDTGIVMLVKRVVKYYEIEHKFKDFNRMLVDFEDDLQVKQKDIGFEEAIDTHLVVHTLRQEQQNRVADFENFKNFVMERFNEEKEHREFVEEHMRKLQFYERRTAPDGNLPNPVKPSELTDQKPLSEGNYWTIHTAVLDKEKVTVKRIRDVNDHNVQASFQKETVNLMRFSRGSIVRVIGMCDEEHEKFLVLEYMEKGDLSTLLHKSGEEISLSNKVTLATTAARAFYVMSHKLVHTSLRTEKFLVDKYYTAKLSGMRYAKTFSSARRYGSKKPVVDLTCYLAPELYQPRELSPEVDVYGFGIVLWEIFTQTKPFSTLAKEIGKEPTHAEVKKFVVHDKGEEYDVGSGPIETMVGEIIRDCRALDPKKRPSVSEILNRLEKVGNELEDEEDGCQ